MNQEHTSVGEMWRDYFKSIGEADENSKCTSWHFCDNEKDANDLAELVKQGIKRATTGLYYFYELEREPLPKVGDMSTPNPHKTPASRQPS
ncbi:hypothetical protein [Desulfosporosinus sp. FKA]|uniref:hypothetical protein n=1 Tax=Desulfosporosinus sp. FKA TaxID=1969834 RepID=UPI000B49F615|nr:hypothetical protein [Desulfosporosinus sp. FKA]